MVEFKLVIGTKQGKCLQKEVKEPESRTFIGKKIGDKISGNSVGLAGYEFLITGGSDHCGFPMRQDVDGPARKRILAVQGIGLKKKSAGIRQRKTVCGNTIHPKISQINLKVVTEGKEPLITETKKEEKKAEKKEAVKETKPAENKAAKEEKKTEEKAAKPAEKPSEKKEAEKKEEKPQEKPVEVKKAEKKEDKTETKKEAVTAEKPVENKETELQEKKEEAQQEKPADVKTEEKKAEEKPGEEKEEKPEAPASS